MADVYAASWAARGGDYTTAYGDGYADGRCFEGPFSFGQGMCAGAAVAFGLMGMAEAIRKRKRPGPVCRGYKTGCECMPCVARQRANLTGSGG